MSNRVAGRQIGLDSVEPRGTRQQWRRSSVLVADDTVYAGTAAGALRAFDAATGTEQFRAAVGERCVTLSATEAEIVAGARGPDGWIRGLDKQNGTEQWAVRSADDIGEPADETLFDQPFVVDLVSDNSRVYAAARRYERETSDGGGRSFEGIVYAIENGDIRWQFETDASPIALDVSEDKVVLACNRCPGEDDAGVYCFDAETGVERWRFRADPPGQRRVGDVAVVDGGVAVGCHADYRGYLLDEDGTIQWRVDLGRPIERGDETLYTYPTHAAALGDGVAFLTGNTFPEEGRQADGRHDHEHSVAIVSADGSVDQRVSVGGWVGAVAPDGDGLLIPCGQHFRDRDPDQHGWLRITDQGIDHRVSTGGPVTAIHATADWLGAIEDPVSFHDHDGVHGEYSLHIRQNE